ncbi:MAG: hypothetical protein CO094_08095 [Anaerolineae bacterium CG_4_9_14_3_um_filter_57_17]|nr:MAG: hypothetical protein CO094_08095 [Anaerolineae bacterium CG_4_9_14_3_um_filter_57_17]
MQGITRNYQLVCIFVRDGVESLPTFEQNQALCRVLRKDFALRQRSATFMSLLHGGAKMQGITRNCQLWTKLT